MLIWLVAQLPSALGTLSSHADPSRRSIPLVIYCTNAPKDDEAINWEHLAAQLHLELSTKISQITVYRSPRDWDWWNK